MSAGEDLAWRCAAVAALEGCAPTLVALAPASVLDPGLPIVLVWTAHAAAHAETARKLVAGRDDVIVWRPDGAPAPDWLAQAYPLGPEMPARALLVILRLVRAETAREARTPRARSRTPRPAAAPVLSLLALLALLAAAGVLTTWRWPRPPAAAAAAPEGLRGLQ